MDKYDLIKGFIRRITDKDNLTYLNNWKIDQHEAETNQDVQWIWFSCKKDSPYGNFLMFIGWEMYKYLIDVNYDEQVKLVAIQPHAVEEVYFDGSYHVAIGWKFIKDARKDITPQKNWEF